MNKVFLFALLALVAACAAAPQEFSPVDETPTDSVKQIDAAPVVELPGHEETKRSIFYRTPFPAPLYPVGGQYRYASPVSALAYLSRSYPYYGYGI